MTRDIKTISDAELSVLDSASYLALCPLDGRYVAIAKKLANYFSEYALVSNRVKVEVEWLHFIIDHLDDPNGYLKKYSDAGSIQKIRSIYYDFDKSSFDRVKEIEAKTNHDVKAVEYFIDEKLEDMDMKELISFVHIGCTSEDITNPAYAAMISSALEEIWIPAAEEFVDLLSRMASANKQTAMLAHTHGQPATPTVIGKEQFVGIYRLQKCIDRLKHIGFRSSF